MPTKIVSTQSNPEEGEIYRDDLIRILDAFEDHVQLSTNLPEGVVKTSGIGIPIWILKKLVDDAIASGGDGDTDKYVIIHFGVSLPNQKSCIDLTTDRSNNLTAVVNIGKKIGDKMEERLEINDEIITLGFKPQRNEQKAVPVENCCSNPKGT